MATERIPFFPVSVVLLPGMTAPLHIFEQRYKRTRKTLTDDEVPLGMVLAREDGIATAGRTGTILPFGYNVRVKPVHGAPGVSG